MSKPDDVDSVLFGPGEERCQRCGHVGSDRRTLLLACFYNLHELHIPFEQVAIEGVYKKKVGEEESKHPFPMLANRPPLMVPVFEADPDVDRRDHQFYTLRICKDCRGQWMEAMARWFDEVTHDDTAPGSGIFVRKNGRNVEISREEWERDYGDRK